MSYFTTLGLNCTILIPAPELVLRSWEANTLCRRVTARVETDRTTASSRGIQARLSNRYRSPSLGLLPPPVRNVVRDRVKPRIRLEPLLG